MPQRFLRPGITNSERWNSVSFEAQSLFIRILTLVDDFGRYDARIPILHGQCFALRNDIKPQRTAALRSELQEARLIEVYEVGGREYLQMSQWQERARQERSKFPDPSQVIDISTSAGFRSGPQDSAASIDHRPSPVHPVPSTINHPPSGYAVPACFENIEGFAAALAGWIEHRKKIRKPPTGRAIQLIINRLAEHPERAVKALDACVEKGWQSFEWEYLDNAKRTNSNQRPDSNRNVGHNANLDYSKRSAESQARADRKLSEARELLHGLSNAVEPKPESGA